MSSPRTEIILGPPGTGKTTQLLERVEHHLSEGVSPSEIAYLAFTRKAADEAVSRALVKFPQFTRADFRYFRTIHSFCFRQLGMNRQRIMQPHHYRELGDYLGLEVRGTLNNYSDMGFEEAAPGDKAIFMENVARNRCVALETEWEQIDPHNLSYDELDRYARALVRFKDNKMLVDYTDLLTDFLHHGVVPRLRVVIVDEAQDLSLLQWRVIDALRKSCELGYYCGDDDQSIYRWAGAATDHFVRIDGTTRVLDQTFRVPRSVKQLADSVIGSIEGRRHKVWSPVRSEGQVDWLAGLDELDLGEGTWYLLGRNISLLRDFEDLCRRLGVPYETNTGRRGVDQEVVQAIIAWTRYTRGHNLNEHEIALIGKYQSPRAPTRGIWHDCLDRIPIEDREFYISCLRRGEDLRTLPRVKISTIHGVKGGEADHVVLRTDMTRQSFDGYMNNPDDEARVFYVGLTRARRSVTIVSPETNLWYSL